MNRFPLTIPQQGLWSGHLLNDDKAMFNTAECIAFDGKVEAAVLAAALAKAVGECEALKGHFEQDGEAVCFVSHELPLAYEEISLEHDDETLARAWAWADLRRPFELTQEAPCRFALLRGPGRDYLYSCVHHIALDGFGTTLLFQRIAELYAEGLAGEMNSPSPFGSLAEVLAEEASREQSGKNDAARAFWQEQLQGWPEVKSFGETRAPIAAEFSRESRPLPAALWQSLTGFADEHKLGWPDLLLAGLSAQLSLSSGQNKTLFGLMMMNRIGSASLTVPCMQMNITPLALTLGEELDLAGAAGAVAKAKRGVRKHQHYRYELLRRDLGLVGATSGCSARWSTSCRSITLAASGRYLPIFSTSAPARWRISPSRCRSASMASHAWIWTPTPAATSRPIWRSSPIPCLPCWDVGWPSPPRHWGRSRPTGWPSSGPAP